MAGIGDYVRHGDIIILHHPYEYSQLLDADPVKVEAYRIKVSGVGGDIVSAHISNRCHQGKLALVQKVQGFIVKFTVFIFQEYAVMSFLVFRVEDDGVVSPASISSIVQLLRAGSLLVYPYEIFLAHLVFERNDITLDTHAPLKDPLDELGAVYFRQVELVVGV